MEVFEGVTNKIQFIHSQEVNGTHLQSTISSNTSNITFTGLTHDSGSITITATSASVSLSKTMSLAKSKQGADGTDGTSAKLLIGSLDSQVMAFDNASDTSADPQVLYLVSNNKI